MMTVNLAGTADSVIRDGDSRRCADPVRRRLLNGTGTLTVSGSVDIVGGTESGSGTTIARAGRRSARRVSALDGGRTLQLGGTSTATGTYVQINLNGANPNTGVSDAGSGILTIASGATFNDQTTSSGLNIFTTNHGWHRHRQPPRW